MTNLAEDTNIATCCGTCGCKQAAAVPAKVHPVIQDFLSERQTCLSQSEFAESAINFVFPEIALSNWRSFEAVLRKYSLAGRTLFTSKPNKSKSILSALSLAGAGIDVSSKEALIQALSCGTPGTRIQVSGPKSSDYLLLAIQQRCLISINDLGELSQLIELTNSEAKSPKTRILLRLSGFKSEYAAYTEADTPFGIRVKRIDEAFKLLLNSKEQIELVGVHFHLLSGAIGEKLVAFENCIEALQKAQAAGFNPRVVNIGGGFPIQYAQSKEDWVRFQEYLKASLLGERQTITWEGAGLGFRAESGRIAGAAAYLNHVPDYAGASALEEFLNLKCQNFGGISVATMLRDLMFELYLEPGRAILDQAGVTLAKVITVSKSANGQDIAHLNLNYTNLRSKDQKLLIQPVFIAQALREYTPKNYFLFGNLCTTEDLLMIQKVYPDFELERGDRVAFVNTAAYHMDFCESQVLHQSLPKKVAVFKSAAGFQAVPEDVLSLSAIKKSLEL